MNLPVTWKGRECIMNKLLRRGLRRWESYQVIERLRGGLKQLCIWKHSTGLDIPNTVEVRWWIKSHRVRRRFHADTLQACVAILRVLRVPKDTPPFVRVMRAGHERQGILLRPLSTFNMTRRAAALVARKFCARRLRRCSSDMDGCSGKAASSKRLGSPQPCGSVNVVEASRLT